MPNYNFLPHNESEFPHIENIDTYKYDNDFDYGRFDYDQMSLIVCTVPWDMGEAHIGNRTISGIGNVVYFGSKQARDEWFEDIPDSDCYRFTTKFKELHRDGFIDVPIPYDMCAKHNYLVVHYEKFANENSPVMLEGDDGLRDWFWFIREVEFLAPNTTRLHIMDDAFQTWIYDVDITGMILERGHAPMFDTLADEYLADPIGNNTYLLTEDVNYGEAEQVKHIDALALNAGTMYACIATTATPEGAWGTKAGNNWKVPASSYYVSDGVPSVFVFAVSVSSLNTFLAIVDTQVPQFKETLQGIFFASSDLVTTNGSFTFAGTTCYRLVAGRKTFEFVELDKTQFGYDTQYADIAKLYTSPYAHIEITDENGSVDIVKIEDTAGEIEVSAALSLAYPFINIDTHLIGVGGSASASVTYRNIDAKTFNISGAWYKTLKSWSVPTFAVVQDASINYDYSTHFDRAQMVVDYTTAYDNEIASATTAQSNANLNASLKQTNESATAVAKRDDAYANADTAYDNATASAATQKTNEDANADLVTDNALLATTANTAITAVSKTSADSAYEATRYYNLEVCNSDNAAISASATSTISAANEQAAVATAAATASGVVNAVADVAGGDIPGAVKGAANSVIGAVTTIANTSIQVGLTQAKATIAQTSNTNHATYSNIKSLDDRDLEQTALDNMLSAQNTLTTGQAANSSATTKANAARVSNTETANAGRTYTTANNNASRDYTTESTNIGNTYTTETTIAQADYNTASANAGRSRTQAQSAIANDIAQAALSEPLQFGAFDGGESAATKPMAIFAHIVTQSKSAIASAGDEFLRYGYMLDRQWDFDGDWNIGRYFTYWKLKDFWVKNLNVPDMYMDRLRFFLFGGVTIWRKPEDIGNVSVYDNFNQEV